MLVLALLPQKRLSDLELLQFDKTAQIAYISTNLCIHQTLTCARKKYQKGSRKPLQSTLWAKLSSKISAILNLRLDDLLKIGSAAFRRRIAGYGVLCKARVTGAILSVATTLWRHSVRYELCSLVELLAK